MYLYGAVGWLKLPARSLLWLSDSLEGHSCASLLTTQPRPSGGWATASPVLLGHSITWTLCEPMDSSAHGLARLLCPQGFSRQEYWSGLPCPPPGSYSPTPSRLSPTSPAPPSPPVSCMSSILLLCRIQSVEAPCGRRPVLPPTPWLRVNLCPQTTLAYPQN